MTKRQIDRLLMSAVAEALGVTLNTPPAGRGGDTKTSSRHARTAHMLETA